MIVLSRYELARLVGLRAFSSPRARRATRRRVRPGAPPGHGIRRGARAIHARHGRVRRAQRRAYHVSTVTFPPDLATMLNSRDGGTRST